MVRARFTARFSSRCTFTRTHEQQANQTAPTSPRAVLPLCTRLGARALSRATAAAIRMPPVAGAASRTAGARNEDLFLGADHRLAARHNLAALRQESVTHPRLAFPRCTTALTLGLTRERAAGKGAAGAAGIYLESVATLVKLSFGPFLPPRGQPSLR